MYEPPELLLWRDRAQSPRRRSRMRERSKQELPPGYACNVCGRRHWIELCPVREKKQMSVLEREQSAMLSGATFPAFPPFPSFGEPGSYEAVLNELIYGAPPPRRDPTHYIRTHYAPNCGEVTPYTAGYGTERDLSIPQMITIARRKAAFQYNTEPSHAFEDGCRANADGGTTICPGRRIPDPLDCCFDRYAIGGSRAKPGAEKPGCLRSGPSGIVGRPVRGCWNRTPSPGRRPSPPPPRECKCAPGQRAAYPPGCTCPFCGGVLVRDKAPLKSATHATPG
eukprot:gene14767-biopygen189